MLITREKKAHHIGRLTMQQQGMNDRGLKYTTEQSGNRRQEGNTALPG